MCTLRYEHATVYIPVARREKIPQPNNGRGDGGDMFPGFACQTSPLAPKYAAAAVFALLGTISASSAPAHTCPSRSPTLSLKIDCSDLLDQVSATRGQMPNKHVQIVNAHFCRYQAAESTHCCCKLDHKCRLTPVGST